MKVSRSAKFGLIGDESAVLVHAPGNWQASDLDTFALSDVNFLLTHFSND